MKFIQILKELDLAVGQSSNLLELISRAYVLLSNGVDDSEKTIEKNN